MMDYIFWLSDAQFARLAPLLPTDTRGVALVDDRRVISGIVHVLKSGGRWVDAPSTPECMAVASACRRAAYCAVA
jgi:transposase